jgi:MraZ protein
LAFRGQYEHSLDSKDRLTVPARFRATFADGVVLLESLDPCVEVYPTEAFERMSERFLSGESPMSKKGRMRQRRFHARARDETIDSAGRVRLPGHMVRRAGLEGMCVVVGVDDHLEVWHPERWSAHLEEVDAEMDRMYEEDPASDEG